MRNVTIKRVLAYVLAAVVVLMTMSGCGNQTNESSTPTSSSVNNEKSTESSSETPKSEEATVELEPVTLKWYYYGDEGEGTDDVIKVFNEKLADVLPNTTVDFEFVSDYATGWSMAMAASEEIDLAWAGWKTSMYTDALDGNYIVLTDLVNEYAPNIAKEIEIWQSDYESGSLDGELYAIPCVQPAIPEAQAWRVDRMLEPYLDLEALMEEFHTTTKATAKSIDMIEAAIKAAIDDGVFKVGDTSWNINKQFYQWGIRGYVQLGNNLYYDSTGENPGVMYIFEIPEVKMLVEYMAKWRDWGWITETQVMDALPEGSRQLLIVNPAYNQNWADANEIGVKIYEKDVDGYEKLMLLTNKPEQGIKGITTFGSASSYVVVPFTSKNPERAMMLLNILHDEAGTVGNDLLNLLCYGFEKNSAEAKEYGWYNYEAVEEDGQLRVDTSVRGETAAKHEMTNWKMGNTYKTLADGTTLTTKASKEYAMKFYETVYPKMVETPITGLVKDTSGITLTLENITPVHKEYVSQIQFGCGGSAEVESLMGECMDKMYASGLQEAKDYWQAKIDEYIAKK